MSLTINGTVESIIPRKKDNGDVYSRMYQIKVTTQGGYKKLINIDDFDLKRKVEVGREITLPIYCDVWLPTAKDGRAKAPVLQYHAIKEDNAKLFTPKQEIKV